MKKNPFVITALIAATAAIVVVVVLKILGYDNPVAIAGGAAGGIAGVLSSTFFGKKRT